MRGPAYRIQTARLVIKCWDPSEAQLLKTAIDESLEHLRPWMPWALKEPTTVDDKIERLRVFRGKFDLGEDFAYGVFDRDAKVVLGGTGLHPRIGPGALEIGYWIHAAHLGRGLATETASVLTRVGFELHEVDRMEIHCDPDNTASAAIPGKLGYTLDATLRRRMLKSDGTPRDTMVWSMLRDEYASGQLAKVELEAFDAAGRRLVL